MNRSLLVGLTFLAFFYISFAILSDPKPPVWSPSFSVSYDETFVKDGKSYTINGQLFFDAVNKRQRADKSNSHYDATCNSTMPNVNTKCQHLIVDQKRYIVFPEKNQCCFCCDA